MWPGRQCFSACNPSSQLNWQSRNASRQNNLSFAVTLETKGMQPERLNSLESLGEDFPHHFAGSVVCVARSIFHLVYAQQTLLFIVSCPRSFRVTEKPVAQATSTHQSSERCLSFTRGSVLLSKPTFISAVTNSPACG